MNKHSLLHRLALLTILLTAPHFASAAVFTWNWTNGVSADLNWSDTNNWSPAAIPGVGDAVVFNSLNAQNVAPGPGLTATGGGQAHISPANFNSYIDGAFAGTISSLVCSNLAGTYQNILLAQGTTLNITNSAGMIIGNGTTPGTGGNEYGSTTQFVTIAGTNATVKVNNTNALFWVTFGSNAGGSPVNTLDLSALDNFSATVSRVLIGVPALNRPGGICYLAATNNITAEFQTAATETSDTVGTGGIVIGDPTANNGGNCFLFLGQMNTIKADTICIARQKSTHGQMSFNPNLTGNPVANFSGFNNARISVWAMSDGVVNGGTTTTTATSDFSLGTVNAMVNTMFIGRASTSASGTGNSVGTLTMAAGAFNVNNLNLGLQTVTTGKNGQGTFNVNSNSTLGVAATLIVNTNLALGLATGGAGAATTTGTLNINGGSAYINNIIAGNAGLGNSTINQTAGVLVITNTAGTTAAPLGTVNLNGTLQLSVSSAVPEMVTTNLTINGPVIINIAALPIITTYPAIFPLIKCLNPINGDPSQITNGFLPAGTPPFTGYITNDTANSSIDLVVTTGFKPIGVDIWTGVLSSNWDLVTANWTLFGSNTVYQNGVNTQFDDTGLVTNVNLTASLLPASLTVSNLVKSYTFGGIGGIAGATGLTKAGAGQLTINNSGTNSFGGGISVNGGTLQFGTGGVTGGLPATGAPITDNGTLVLDHSDNLAIASTITGAGSLVQAGAGVVSLTSSNSYTGSTLVTNGSLMLDGYVGGTSTSLLTNAPGTTIGGNGTNLGTFNAAGNINPGDVNAIGTLSTANGLTLSPTASATFDVNASDSTVGNNVNDLLQVTGDLNVNNNTISLRSRGVPQGGTYGVITYTGNLTGSFNPVVGGTHFSASIDTNTVGQVNVTITGNAGANLKWSSTNSGVWDAGVTTNWLNLGTAALDVFDAGDTVTLDDSVAGVQTNLTIGAGVFIYPTAFTNASSADNYTISGAGTISGSTSLVKDGSSTLTINTTNSFSGGVNILKGTLKTGSATALGLNGASFTTTVASNATLDVNGQNLGSEQIVVSGPGVGGLGALINSGAQQINAFKNVQLAGDVVFGGPERWDIRGGSATLNTTGVPCNVIKIGTNQVALVACTCSDNNLENVDIQGGIFGIQTSSSQYGDPNGTITVHANALLDLWALPAGLNKNIVLQDGGGIYSENGSTTITGTLTLGTNGSTCVLTNNTGTTLVVNSTVQGTGDLLKAGPAVTQLGSANTYTGTTTVSGGTLSLTNSGTLSTNNITIGASATLDVSAANPLTLVAGQTLQGSGTLNGGLTASIGSVVAPGSAAALGTLTVSGGGIVTLAGTTQIKLNKSGATATSDNLAANAGINFGGTLSLSVLSGTLTGGEVFHLFTSGALAGTFTLSPTTAGPGLTWNTNNLAVDGTLSVVATALPKLTIANGSTPGTLVISSSQAGTLYSAPAANGPYTVVGPINGSVTINVSLSTPARFFRVTVP